MCRRTQWLNVGKADFLKACKERRIGAERAESLWARLDELAKAQIEATVAAQKASVRDGMVNVYPLMIADESEGPTRSPAKRENV